MNDFDDIKTQLKVFCDKISQLQNTKPGNYSARLEIPQLQKDGTDIYREVSGNVGKFTGHLHLLQNSESLSQEINKQILTNLSKKLVAQVDFYAKQWGDKHDPDFCKQLSSKLQNIDAVIAAYSRPSNTPRPHR